MDVAVSLALRSSSRSRSEVVSVRGGHRPRHARLVVAHVESGRGLLTATALGVEALGRIVTGSRSSDRYRSRRDRSRRERSRSVDRSRSRRERARSPALGGAAPLSLLWLLEGRWMLLLLQEGHP